MAVTSGPAWKKTKKTEDKEYELTVPSGNVCLVKRPGPELFVRQGMIPNALMGIIMPLLEDAREQGKTGDSSEIPEEAMAELQKELLADPSKFADMMTLIDNITVACVVEPVVRPEADKGKIRAEIMAQREVSLEDREAQIRTALEEHLFVDEVDFEDKVFIFQYAVGGSADMERFRLGTESLVAAGPAGAEVQRPAE